MANSVISGGSGGVHGVGEEKILNGRTVKNFNKVIFYLIETCGREMTFLRQLQAVQE